LHGLKAKQQGPKTKSCMFASTKNKNNVFTRNVIFAKLKSYLNLIIIIIIFIIDKINYIYSFKLIYINTIQIQSR